MYSRGSIHLGTRSSFCPSLVASLYMYMIDMFVKDGSGVIGKLVMSRF
jgi:hypothetical protein